MLYQLCDKSPEKIVAFCEIDLVVNFLVKIYFPIKISALVKSNKS